MANQAPVKDPSKWGVLILGVVLILSAVVFFLLALKNTVTNNATVGERDIETLKINNAATFAEKSKSALAKVESRIAPVGEVIVGAGAASGKVVASRSGEEVYTAVCSACHSATGLPTAPKINEKAAWEARASNGFKGLLDKAIKGTSGGMPARAGQNISDEELTVAIAYMTKEAGLTLDIPVAGAKEAPAENVKKEETPVAEDVKKEAVLAAEAAKEEETPVAKAAGAATASAVVATTVEKASDTVDTTKEVVAVAQADNSVGEKIYKKACFSCHGVGVLGAPRLGNVEEWKARVTLGKEELYKSAIQGKQSMPPKGGNFNLSDDDIKAVVDYMISESS